MKSGRSGFRYRPNRNEELTIQNELEQLEKKSLKEISASRELRKQQVFADEYSVTRQLAPHFKHERTPEKRRLEPMFPADPPLRTLKPDLLKVSSKAPPNSPSTVQIATPTAMANGQLVRTKKYPYCKPEAIRIKDMNKTHRTTVGVLPLNRDSMEISELKVIMEGKQLNAAVDALDNISMANRCESQTLSVTPEPSAVPPAVPDSVPAVESTQQEPPEPSDQSVPAILGQSKPAILGKTGTTQPITFSQRQKPPPKPKTKLKPRKMLEIDRSRSAKSTQSSLMSGELILPGRTAFSQYDEALDELESNLENVTTAVGSIRPASGGPSGPSSAHTSRPGSSASYKSAKALLEEARRLASPQAVKSLEQKYIGRPGRDLRSKSDRSAISKDAKKRDKGRAKSLMSSRDDDSMTMSSQPRSERTVDEIISSLRIQSRTGERSEADIRIQEIMEQVLSRTSVLLGDGSEAGSTSDVQESEKPDQVSELSDQSDRPVSPSDQSDTLLVQSETADYLQTIGGTETVKLEEDGDTEPVETSELVIPDADASTAVCAELDLDPSTLPDVPPPLTGIQSDRSTSTLDSQQEMEVTIQQAWEDLLLPPEATYEDIVNVEGQAVDLEMRRVGGPDTGEVIPVQSTAVSFLSTWAPGEEIPKLEAAQRVFPEKTIHHFCTSTTAYQLPKSLQGIGRKYHTPSKYGEPFHPYRFNARPLSKLDSSRVGGDTVSEATEGGMSRRQSLAAAQILEEASKITEDGQTMEMWAEKAEQMLSVEGSRMPLRTDESRLYWTPAPPRLDVPPAKVKDMLFPQYEGHVVSEEFEATEQAEDSSDDSEEEEPVDPFYIDPEDREHRDRILARRYQSNEDLTRLMIASRERDEALQAGSQHSKEEGPEEGSQMSEIESRETTVSDLDFSKGTYLSRPLTEEGLIIPGTDDILPVLVPLRKTRSVTKLMDDADETLIIPNDFSEAMEEIQKMKEKISDLRMGKKRPEKPKVVKVESEPEVDQFDNIFTTQVEEVDQTQPVHTDAAQSGKTKHRDKPTPAEQALAAGRSYVILPKKKKKRKPVDLSRVEAVQRFLSTSPSRINRTSSLPRLHRPVDRELRVPFSVRSQRRGSLPAELDFKQFAAQKGKLSESDLREWVRDLWNVWFDQVFPPTPEGSEGEDEGDYMYTSDSPETGFDDTGYKGNQRRVSLVEIESVDCLDDTEENEEIRDILLEEVLRLTQEIESTDKPLAFDIGRRGAIYRKLGKLKKATVDINRAIQMEPLLLDAYWHRHLISLVLGKKQAALDDLTFILKHNKKHAGAYRSMAEIFRDQGEITMAIVNYTQAIKLNPEDHDAYSRRAEMYEKRGEMRLALEDYSKATKLQPTKTDAIFKHGMYFFHNESWNNAINDFNDLLKVEPTNSQARMFRGRAYANLGQYNAAVADLSGAIHMDPNNWMAFYHRGCLLRRAHPQRALLDFSMSLLVNETEENLMSYFHRGILYNALDRPQDAIPDFEAVLKLDSSVPSAHINLGLIYMTKYQDYHRAIKKFSAAVKVDPTCVRAIVCRGECYHKVHDIRNALKDFTRAIHLAPDVHHYYMYRGQLVLEMGNLELAAFCVRHASELGADSSLGQSSTQQAVVQTFLRNYDKAVEVLTAETRQTPVAPLFMLLGKTQIKAKSYKDAIESFQRALALYKPWSQWEPWPVESAEAHYLMGMCHMELRHYSEALDAFNSAIKINSHHAESFYQRGLTKIRLKQAKGIQDFNRALALDPTLYQVFLSRACYYGMKGKYAKAILNCNEAIKLQPHSVRSYLYRGSLKFHIKAYELAIRDLTIAARLDNTCSLAFFNRAVCYQHYKLYDKALTDYGIVLLLGEDLSIKVLINRGLLYFEKGDYINALYDFKMAAKLHPWDHNIHHSLGLCYHKLNRLQESVVAFTKSLTEKPSFLEALVARGNVYMDYGHEEGRTQARVDYQRVLLYNPNFFSARVNLAYALQVRGRFMQAWRQFTAVIDVNPNYCPALEGRSIVNLQMRDMFAAIQDINAAIDVNPTAELLTNRGVIHQFMKDGVNAMKDYHLALKKDPTYALAYFNAANIHFHTRHFKQALDYYNKAIRCNPKDESAYLNRAITKVLLRDAPGALEDFKLAIKLSPHSAHIYFNRGNLHASMAKFDKAELDYNKALSLKPDDPLVLKRRADVRGKLGRRDEAIADYRWAITIQSQVAR